MNEQDPLPSRPDHPTSAAANGASAAADEDGASGATAAGAPDEQPTAAPGAAPTDDQPTTFSAAAATDFQPTTVSGAAPTDFQPPTVSGAAPADDQPTTVLGAEAPGDRTMLAGGEAATRIPDGPTEVRGSGQDESSGGAGLPSGGAASSAGGAGFPSGEARFPPGGAGFPSGGAGFPSGGAGSPSGGAGFPPPPGGGVPPGAEPPAGGGGWSGSWAYGPRRLTRSTQRKVIGGVAGGLGEYTGIDPVLFRVLFAVLTLFGGSGILLYGACWLFLPADDQPVSPVESLIGRGNRVAGRTRDTTVAAALIAAGLVLAGVVALGDARDLALCLVIVAGAYFLLRNLRERRAGGPPQPIGPEPPPVAYQAFDVPPPTYQPGATATITAPVAAPPKPPKAPKPKREHSILGVLTICVLLIAVGITAALDNGDGGGPDAQTYLAIATGIIGLGLLVGTVVGRARWLAWLGLPCLALLVVVSTSGIRFEGGVGDRSYAPAAATDIQQTYQLGVGSLVLDLTNVDLSEQQVRTKLSLGVGDLNVIVPRNADVSVKSRAGIGGILLFDQEEQDGTSVTRDIVDPGIGGDGRIDLVLDLDVNIGQVRVDRAQA